MSGGGISRSAPAGAGAGGAVELFAARTPREEVEWTAARILELVRREGLRFRGHRGGSPILQDLSGFGGVGVRPVRGAGVLLLYE